MTAETRESPRRQLAEACASVRDVFDAKGCVCAVVDGEHLEFVAGDGQGSDWMVGVRMRVGEGISGYVAQAGVPVEVPDVRGDDRFAAHLAVDRGYTPEVMLGAPLVDEHGAVVGVLNVLDPSAVVAAGATATVGGVLPVLAVVAGDVAGLVARPAFGGEEA
jgi:signal transduction protein with GAF and PtsI domain